ncbi:FCS-Like Zinc finger 3-like [Salvia hispanica]|uniref:FCS-Like Zinc finger 3-like n=1 Tax=Salvia hispanica TaxID=49212 RepID=UPI002009CA36|nr:FCS-Like Zinc finger 3-like [Salvia hispanica]
MPTSCCFPNSLSSIQLNQTTTAEMSTAVAYYYTGCEHDYEPHFLDSCSLCGRSLCQNNDIFMYRGNTPFCSQECRQEQIEMDEAMEKKRWKRSSSSKRSSAARQSSDESDMNKAVRTGTVAVA